MMYIVLTKLF